MTAPTQLTKARIQFTKTGSRIARLSKQLEADTAKLAELEQEIYALEEAEAK